MVSHHLLARGIEVRQLVEPELPDGDERPAQVPCSRVAPMGSSGDRRQP
jgi:hypothetical protein